MKISFKSVLLSCCLLFSISSKAQNKLTFCFSVNEDGSPFWEFNTITYSKDNNVKCLLTLDRLLDSSRYIVYKVYYYNEKKEFELKNAFTVDFKPIWGWVYYQIHFNSPGVFKVVTESEDEKILAQSIITLLE